MKTTSVFASLLSAVAAMPAGSVSLDSRAVTKNWAGASLQGNGWSSVTGTITAPDISGTSASDVAAIWVGIDGKSCRSLWQTGVTFRGDGTINGWYEWLPSRPQPFAEGFVVSAGDQIRMTITATSSTSGAATLENLTTGKSASKTMSAPGSPLCLKDADWIVEDFGQKNLANFGTVDFTAASATSSAGDSDPAGSTIVNVVADGITRTSCSADANGVECKWVQ